MNAPDIRVTELHGPPVNPRWAARRLSTHMIAKDYVPGALHAYPDRDGSALYWRIRLKHHVTGKKWIRPMRREGIDYALGEPEFHDGKKPLYRLDVVATDSASSIWFVEGESKVDALTKLGARATTTGSATSDDKAAFDPLRGQHVILWPDNDEPGREHMRRVAGKFLALGCTVQIVDIGALDLPEGGDVIDYLASHPDATAADLMALRMIDPSDADTPPTSEVHHTRADNAMARDYDARAEVPQALRALNVMQLATHRFPERRQLLGPLIHAGDLAMWFALRGVGKTQVALSIGSALAFGGVFLRWRAAAPVGVLFLDGEMAGRVMQERVASFLPVDAGDELSDNFRLFTPDLLPLGQPLPDLTTADGQVMVEGLIDGNTRVIIIDNLSAWCRTGKENESESWTPMADWLLTLRRRGIAVLLIHHAGKNGEQRGNSKKEDTLDLVIRLRRAGDYDPKTGAAFTWSVTKGRHLYGEDAADLDLTLKIADGVAHWDWKLAETSTADRVGELAEEGMSATLIAEELGINRSTAWRALKKSGKLPGKPKAKGAEKGAD